MVVRMDAPLPILGSDLEALEIELNEDDLLYFAVKIREFFIDRPLPCDIYCPIMEGRRKLVWKKLAPKGRTYGQNLYEFLKRKGIGELYAPKERQDAFFKYFEENLEEALRSSRVPIDKKNQFLYDSVELIIKKAFREQPNDVNIDMGRKFVERFEGHIATGRIDQEMLCSQFSKDYNIFSHSVQVAMLGMLFERFLAWNRYDIMDFGVGALFHDIGKTSIKPAILNKPSRLDRDEFATMKKHTAIGYRKLKGARMLSDNQRAIALYHHEAMDGSGYPDGLEGEKIHKFVRVARIVDVYDALTTKRVYKKALTPLDALSIMTGEMGPTFDRSLLNAFISFLGLEEKMKNDATGTDTELGKRLQLQPEGGEFTFEASLVRVKSGEHLIVHISPHVEMEEYFQNGKRLIARCLHAGKVCAFEVTVLGSIMHPLRLMFLSYPKKVEILDSSAGKDGGGITSGRNNGEKDRDRQSARVR